MRDEAYVAGLVGFLAGAALGILFGLFLGVLASKKEAISSGHAHYNQVSGELEWGPPVVVPEQK